MDIYFSHTHTQTKGKEIDYISDGCFLSFLYCFVFCFRFAIVLFLYLFLLVERGQCVTRSIHYTNSKCGFEYLFCFAIAITPIAAYVCIEIVCSDSTPWQRSFSHKQERASKTGGLMRHFFYGKPRGALTRRRLLFRSVSPSHSLAMRNSNSTCNCNANSNDVYCMLQKLFHVLLHIHIF